MKDIFKLCAAKRVHRENYDFDLEIPSSSQVRFVLEGYGYKVQRCGKRYPIILKFQKTLKFSKEF